MANAENLPESHHGASLSLMLCTVLPLNVSRQMLKVSQSPTARLVAVRAFDRKVVVTDAVVLVRLVKVSALSAEWIVDHVASREVLSSYGEDGNWRPRASSLLNRRDRRWRW
jgi:hypothetical protein